MGAGALLAWLAEGGGAEGGEKMDALGLSAVLMPGAAIGDGKEAAVLEKGAGGCGGEYKSASRGLLVLLPLLPLLAVVLLLIRGGGGIQPWPQPGITSVEAAIALGGIT